MTQIVSKKQLIKDFHKAQNGFIGSIKNGMEYAFQMGDILLEIKKITPHGQLENVLKNEIDLAFGLRHAQMLMKISSNKTLVLEAGKGEILTIKDMDKLITDATPEQLERVRQIEAEKLAAEERAKADRAAKAAELEAKRAEEETLKQVQTKEPEIIEGNFEEVKEASKPVEKPEELKTGFVQIEAEKMEEIEDSLHELASLNKSISKDNDSMVKIFDANDQLGAAVKEIKRLNDLNTSLEGRLNGFMNERNALIKEAKYWRARAEKLEKANVQ